MIWGLFQTNGKRLKNAQSILPNWVETPRTLLQESPRHLKYLELKVEMTLRTLRPKRGARGTLRVSHGTKFLVSKFLSYHKNKMLFYAFFHLVEQNMPKFMETVYVPDVLLGKRPQITK